MQKKRFLLFLLIFVLLSFTTTTALAQTLPPAVFAGIVTEDGANVDVDNTTVTAFINGVEAGSTTTIAVVDGVTWYGNLQISEEDGGADGAVVTFAVNGTAANESATWRSGSQIVNLTTTIIEDPAADFSFVPSAPVAGQAVQFTDLSTGNIQSRAWDFGDGSGSSDQNPAHTFAAAGSYDVTLTVTDAAGNSIQLTKAVAVAEDNSTACGASEGGLACINIIGGYWLRWQAILFPDTTVTITDVEVTTDLDNPDTWQVVDNTNSSSAWALTLTATDFTNENGSTIPATGFSGWCVSTVINCLAAPGAALDGFVTMAWADAGTGNGVFDFEPFFRLIVPAGTGAGSYESTLTYTLGPE